MSIINQALKKAQREQRLHSMQTLVLPTQPAPVQPRRLWWLVLSVASGIVLGGALWYVWLTSSPTLPTAGCTNGTLTFAALTLRSADRVATP